MCTNGYLLGRALSIKMKRRLFNVLENTSRLGNISHTGITPSNVRGVTLVEDANTLAVNDQVLAIGRHLAFVLSMNGIISAQIDVGGGAAAKQKHSTKHVLTYLNWYTM